MFIRNYPFSKVSMPGDLAAEARNLIDEHIKKNDRTYI